MKPVAAKTLRDDFLAWQCRIRQIAMRQDGGRPSPGMRPRVRDGSGRELSPALTVLIVPRDPAESTDFFRFQVLKTPDPRDLYERALTYLQADYFQQPAEFGDVLTAVLPRKVRACSAPYSRWTMRAGVRAVLTKLSVALCGICGRTRRGDQRGHAVAQSPVQSLAARRRLGAGLQARLEIGRGLIRGTAD